MRRIQLTRAAESDLDAIAQYTLETWGALQAAAYLDRLEDTLDLLAKSPGVGRSANAIRHGLQRFEVERHVVFYFEQDEMLHVVRILHQHMLPKNYL